MNPTRVWSWADSSGSAGRPLAPLLSLLLLLLLLPTRGASVDSLSGYVRHHQMLYYSPLSLGRGRRATGPPLQLHLPAGDRVLALRLVPDTVTLASDVIYSGPSGSAVGTGSLAPLYTGWVLGEPGSTLFGSLIDGVFDGTIVLPNETLVVERASLHVDGGPDGHSFVYRASDMILPPARDGDRPCGVRDGLDPLVHGSDMNELTTGRSEESRRPVTGSRPSRGASTLASTLRHWRSSTAPSRVKRDDDDHHHGADHDEDSESDEEYEKHHDGRHSRTLCSVYVETDPVLFKQVFKRERGSLRRTETVLQWLASSHVQGVNRIFQHAVFDGRHHHHDYKFQIQKLVVSDDHTCLPNYSGRRNRLCFERVDSQTYLEAHSNSNFDAFCLAFAISYHDLEGGTIGLAWIGAPWEGAGRGVCARHAAQAFYNWKTGVVERKSRSLNTAMITLLNYARPVHPLQSQLTLAHEIGHTMGSPHDQGALGSPCLPNDENGNFIMFYLSQDGHLPRHHMFSNCSVGNISRVLDYIMEGRYYNCFAVRGSSFCGNNVVEDGEQCDCGFTAHDCRDRCCWPRHPPSSAGPGAKKAGCRYQPGAACSPSQGPCCDPQTCATVPASANRTCRAGSECTLPALCDGRSIQCPKSARLAELTPCGTGSRVCHEGRCTGSACLRLGLLPCQLTETDVRGDRAQLCVVGCHTHGDAPCRPRAPWVLEAGDPCDADRGVCDAQLRCRPLTGAGPLARLEALLLAGGGSLPLTASSAGRWWLTGLLALLLAVICALLLRCVALHIPSSNPNKPPPRPMTETLRVPLATFFGLSGGGDLQL